jgi:hypothetical protein
MLPPAITRLKERREYRPVGERRILDAPAGSW